VSAFGAFVDVGVHQDGLVHVSELADRYITDPAEVVQAGDRIKVWVKDVDAQRKRIALSAKSGSRSGAGSGVGPEAGKPGERRGPSNNGPRSSSRPAFNSNPFGSLGL